VLAARDSKRLEEVADEVISLGGKAFPVVMDVTDRSSIEEAYSLAEGALGQSALSLIIQGSQLPNVF